MRILIVGNIVKDIYLDLSEDKNNFEPDDNGTPWLDIAFDGSSHGYSRRTSVFGGAAVTLDVINKFGLEAMIGGREIDLEDAARAIKFKDAKPCETYRYVLTRDGFVTYFVPDCRPETQLSAPNEAVDWIFIDRSANISTSFMSDLEKYREVAPNVKLAVFASTRGATAAADVDTRVFTAEKSSRSRAASGSRILSKAMKDLVRQADFVFTDGSLYGTKLKDGARLCEITENEVKLDGQFKHYFVDNTDFLTDLTTYSIIAATVFAAVLSEVEVPEALALAALNAENAKITGVLEKKVLEERLEKLNEMMQNTRFNAKSMVAAGKGILAADESGGSIHKKFEAAGIPDDAEHRRDYRNIFFTTEGLEDFVNGVILFEETAGQKADNGQNFVDFLTSKGIIPGIKVDQGLAPIEEPGYENENYTKGLEGLEKRLKNYYMVGARFTKWRAAFEVTKLDEKASSKIVGARPGLRTPTRHAIDMNTEILAKYARACQDAGIVPIVEPEVVHAGDYSIDTSAELTGMILESLFKALEKQGVDLAACILKTSMVLAGSEYEKQSLPVEVGARTAEVLKKYVPEKLAGVVFLSGGQTVEQSTENLQEITNNGPFPWPVTFSFARALQAPALEAWQGDNANAEAARKAFRERLVANCGALKKK